MGQCWWLFCLFLVALWCSAQAADPSTKQVAQAKKEAEPFIHGYSKWDPTQTKNPKPIPVLVFDQNDHPARVKAGTPPLKKRKKNKKKLPPKDPFEWAANAEMRGLRMVRGPPKFKDPFKKALALIKDEMGIRAHTIDKERKWMANVQQLVMVDYTTKFKKVEAANVKLRKLIAELYRKLIAVKHMEAQHNMQAELRQTGKDLGKLNGEIGMVKDKIVEFHENKHKVAVAIQELESKLKKLEPA